VVGSLSIYRRALSKLRPSHRFVGLFSAFVFWCAGLPASRGPPLLAPTAWTVLKRKNKDPTWASLLPDNVAHAQHLRPPGATSMSADEQSPIIAAFVQAGAVAQAGIDSATKQFQNDLADSKQALQKIIDDNYQRFEAATKDLAGAHEAQKEETKKELVRRNQL